MRVILSAILVLFCIAAGPPQNPGATQMSGNPMFRSPDFPGPLPIVIQLPGVPGPPLIIPSIGNGILRDDMGVIIRNSSTSIQFM
jgi:hypothetical protein